MFRARWNGDTLTPTGHYGLSAAREAMEPGDVVIVEVDHPRSGNSHRHQFAEINEAWRHLPEAVQDMPWAASPAFTPRVLPVNTATMQKIIASY